MNENNILILMPQLFMGGSERQVRYIAEGLEKAHVGVMVLVENGSEADEESRLYAEKHLGICFEFLGLNTLNIEDKTPKNKLKSLVYIHRWIFKNGKKYRWVMFTNLTGLICVPLCRMQGIKVLFNERNPGVKMCNSVWKRKLLKSCNEIVANSKSAAEYMTNILGRNVECVNNGIMEKEALLQEKKSDKLFLLVPARINPVKNQMVVIHAVDILRKRMELHCCFAGQIEDQEYYNKLRRYVEEHQLEEYITFPGYIKNIDELYGQADLIILSSYEEGTPNVVLEAYLQKKPCLASNIVMNRDIAVELDILFEADNPQMLAEKIKWIIQMDKCKLEELLMKGYEFARNNYSMSIMQSKYLQIFSR